MRRHRHLAPNAQESTTSPIAPIAAIILAVLALLAPPATGAHHDEPAAAASIVDVAVAAGGFETLVAAVQAAGLADTLSGDGPFTVFAPTDAAFAALPAGTVESLLEPGNRDRLQAILTYHVAAGELSAAAASGRTSAGTVNGQRLALRFENGRLTIDDATVVTPDIPASNGLIHVIDRVLLPEEDSLVGLATKVDGFNTLLAAATAAGLADTLDRQGPFTLFAPTDAAFDELPDGTIDALLAEEGRSTLRQILTYHVVDGRVFSDDALAAGRATTLAGETVSIGLAEGRLRVNDSGIVATDLDTANGVVHVIDRVLLPPDVVAAWASRGGERMSARAPQSARQVIRLAIDRGVPLFNAGEAEACAAIYEVAAASLVAGGYDLPARARRSLETGLDEAARTGDVRRRAWTLRYALDDAFAALHGE